MNDAFVHGHIEPAPAITGSDDTLVHVCPPIFAAGRRRSQQNCCPACSSEQTIDFLDFGRLPLTVGVVYDSRREALSAPLGHVHLASCRQCGLVFNCEFDPDLPIFEPGYEVALHYSATFKSFIDGVALRLADRLDLNNKRILEIGCGDGYFLRKLAALGGNDCIGVDPTVGVEGNVAVEQGSVSLIRDYFGPAYRNLDADFICCLSVFEAIPRPGNLLADVHAIASRTGAPVYFEVFNAWRAFEQSEVWSGHYEQCNYFSLASLQRMFEQNGFHVDEAGTCYAGDQYIYVIARPGGHPIQNPVKVRDAAETTVLERFRSDYAAASARWQQQLAQYRADDLRVVLWGSGGKGITFLNSVAGTDVIEYVAEINPDKQGKFIPGTGQQIVSPQFLAEYRPDKIIITNALYKEEMQRQATELGVKAEFLVA